MLASIVPRLRGIFLLILALCVCYILVRLLENAISEGGSSWQQGDWLINSHEVWVRRGLFGSLVLAVSDLLAANPAFVVIGLQGALVVVATALFARAALTLEATSALWLLIMSPGFFPIFWAADFGGALRKELLAYGAFALLLASTVGRGSGPVRALAVLVFVLAMLGHEINILLAPAFLAIFLLTARGAAEARPGGDGLSLGAPDVAGIVLVGVVAAAGMAFTVVYMGVEDVGAICAPLLERGLSPGMCTGVIETLADDIPSVWGYGFIRTRLEGAQFAAAYLAITVFFVLLARRSSDRKLMWAVYLGTLLPILPLYPISNDWGRWLNMHVTSVVFVTLALMLAGRIRIAPAPPLLLIAVAVTSLFWAPAHTWGMREWGVAGQVAKILGLL